MARETVFFEENGERWVLVAPEGQKPYVSRRPDVGAWAHYEIDAFLEDTRLTPQHQAYRSLTSNAADSAEPDSK